MHDQAYFISYVDRFSGTLRWSFAMTYEIKFIYFPFIKVASAYDLLKGVIKEALKPFLIILRIRITTDYVPQFGNFISKMNRILG